MERDGAGGVVGHDPLREVAGLGCLGAGVAADDALVERAHRPGHRELPLDRAQEVTGLHGRAVGVHDAGPQMEDVRLATVGRLRDLLREVGHERVAVRSAHLLPGQQPVVDQVQQRPVLVVVDRRVDRAADAVPGEHHRPALMPGRRRRAARSTGRRRGTPAAAGQHAHQQHQTRTGHESVTSCVLHWCLPGGKMTGDRRSPHDDRDWSLRSPGLLPSAGRSVGSATRATDFRTDRHCVVAPLRPCADAPGRDRPGRAGFGAQRLPGDRDAGGSSRRPAGGGRDAGDRPAGRECGDGARLRLADAQRVARGGRPQLRVRVDGRRAGDAAGRHHGAAGVGRRRVQAPARPDRCGRQDRGGGVAEQLDLAVRRRPGAGRPRCDRRGRALPAGWAVLPEPTVRWARSTRGGMRVRRRW